jgi:hypothetical protein
MVIILVSSFWFPVAGCRFRVVRLFLQIQTGNQSPETRH